MLLIFDTSTVSVIKTSDEIFEGMSLEDMLDGTEF